jgi:hypothetical protein
MPEDELERATGQMQHKLRVDRLDALTHGKAALLE